MVPSVENRRNPASMPVDTGWLSRRGKGIILTFIAIGLLTFVLPIVKLEAPVHGQQYQSVLDITQRLQATLHPETPLALLPLVPFGLVYLTLLVAMGAVLLIPFRKVLLWISLVGLFLLYPFRGFYGVVRMAAVFQSSSHVSGLTTVWVILGIAMLAVAGIAWMDTTNLGDYGLRERNARSLPRIGSPESLLQSPESVVSVRLSISLGMRVELFPHCISYCDIIIIGVFVPKSLIKSARCSKPKKTKQQV